MSSNKSQELCCGSLLLVLVSVSVTFHLMYVHIVLVRSKLLSGHLFGKSCPLS